MADYHPLIARAVAGLDKNTGEARRALYERARTALVAQLRGVTPALDESEITRERLALEEAIRKIEAEATRQAREARAAARPPAAAPPVAAPPQPSQTPRAPVQPPPVTPPPVPPVSAQQPPPPPRRPEPPARPPMHEPPARRPASPSMPSRPSQEPRRGPAHGSGSLSDEAMRGFRDAGPVPQGPPAPADKPGGAPIPPRKIDPSEASAAVAASSQTPAQARNRTGNVPSMAPGAATDEHAVSEHAGPAAEGHEPAQDGAGFPPDEPRQARLRNHRGWIRTGLVLLLLAAVGAAAYWQRDSLTETFDTLVARISGPSTPTTTPTTTPSQPKITDRLGQPDKGGADAPAVAQRVVLYEEDPENPEGRRMVGTATWRTETLPAAGGRPPEIAVRADVQIPERNMTMTWSLRRNTDPALPASHTIEIMFTLPADAPGGGVQNVPGVLMKQAEQTRGVPLAGLAVKVTPGFFLIGLSSIETDVQRNVQLLKERPWFDIPIVYNNNRRAILAMEKGAPGERAFAEAFKAWEQ